MSSFCLFGSAQNLVPNPGYETGGCPNTFNGGLGYNGAFPTSWSVFPSITTLNGPATTDYLKTGCYTGLCASSSPHTGNAWIGGYGNHFNGACFGTCNPKFYGEGIKAGLTSNLTPGSTYTVSIWVRHAAGSSCDNGQISSTSGLGIWFFNSSAPPAEYGCNEGGFYIQCGYSLVTTPPQLTIPTNTISGTYQQYTFSYVSTGTFNRIGISPYFGGTTVVNRYYNWDDVSVELDAPCGSCALSGLGSTWRWTGCVSTDWFEACNWDRQSVPTTASNVVIPNVTNDPSINGGTANCYDLTIQPGGLVNLHSATGGILNVVKP